MMGDEQQHEQQRGSPLQNRLRPFLNPSTHQPYQKMQDFTPSPPIKKEHTKLAQAILVASYVSDWACLIAAGAVGTVLGNVTPTRRHFYLNDPNIAFPFTESELVTSKVLIIAVAAVPMAAILLVTLLLVPGATVPKGTPKALIWKRKMWELHIGWLGLAMSLLSAWFITSSMKNLFGKPRPDLLARCLPDLANIDRYVVSPKGLAQLSGGLGSIFQLVSADICQSTDKHKLDDGFRSYPSGHSSSAAAGLVYLSFFLASKFSVTFPFATHTPHNTSEAAAVAFPSRSRQAHAEASHDSQQDELADPSDPMVARQIASHNSDVLALRKQAAAPPVYLLTVILLPFFASVFIAGSRWHDFRHHAFDILFGFLIGLITAWFSFRYYHLPISQGAGWAWAPRSPDKAFWAGIGTFSYATDKKHWVASADEEARGGSGVRPQEIPDIELRMRQYAKAESDNNATATAYRPEHYRPDRHGSPEQDLGRPYDRQ